MSPAPSPFTPAVRYEKNKHVFPMVRWEIFDREKRFDRYTAKDGRQGDRINFAPTLPSATAAAAAGLIMPAAFLSVKAIDGKANAKAKLWDDEAWRRYVPECWRCLQRCSPYVAQPVGARPALTCSLAWVAAKRDGSLCRRDKTAFIVCFVCHRSVVVLRQPTPPHNRASLCFVPRMFIVSCS